MAFTQPEVEVTANHEMDARTHGFTYEAEYRGYLVCIVTPRTGAIPWQVYPGDRDWFHSWGQVTRDTARMLRADLTLARAAWIAEAETADERRQREESDFLKYENSVGEFFDFHACRHGYITLVSETCKSVKQAQTLARVSTPKLLDRYSHIQLYGMQQAADEVGRMLANGAIRQSGRPREAAAAPLAATGTDDEKPAPANRSSRGASPGNSPASGGRMANCDAQSSEPSDQPTSDPKTKNPREAWDFRDIARVFC